MTNKGIARKVITACTEVFGVTRKDILGRSRKAEIVTARHSAIWLCYKYLDMTCSQIGTEFNRDRTLVIYAIKMVENRIACDGLFGLNLFAVELKLFK